jgi:hypothetical protein
MNPIQRSAALTALAHAQAHASTLHDLLTRVSTIREPDGGTTCCTDVDRANELLRRALAEVSRYACI